MIPVDKGALSMKNLTFVLTVIVVMSVFIIGCKKKRLTSRPLHRYLPQQQQFNRRHRMIRPGTARKCRHFNSRLLNNRNHNSSKTSHKQRNRPAKHFSRMRSLLAQVKAARSFIRNKTRQYRHNRSANRRHRKNKNVLFKNQVPEPGRFVVCCQRF
jgi:hypothetical protein